MENNSPLHIGMLGSFTLEHDGNSISDQNGRSKKLWLLIAYLVVFRGREISQNDLVDLLWPTLKKGNPANTLKTLVHRARVMVSELDCGDSRDLIIYHRGTYSWNDKIETIVDLDIFEQLIQDASQEDISMEHRLGSLLEAIEMYKGDFIPKLSEQSWAVPITTYYRSLYKQAVFSAIDLLLEMKNWNEIVSLCKQALQIDPYDEKLHYRYIEALAHSHRQDAAKRHFEMVTEMYFEEFGRSVSDEFNALYKKVLHTLNQTELDLVAVREKLSETKDDREGGAFYCIYEVFKEIYQLDVRNASRTGQAFFLCMLSMTGSENNVLDTEMLNKAMSRLILTLNESLRRGDVFTRYSVSQYLILFDTMTLENAQMVSDRIIKRFRREFPKLPVKVKSSLLPIDTLM